MDKVYSRQPVSGLAGGTGHQQSKVRVALVHTDFHPLLKKRKVTVLVCVRMLVEQMLQDTTEDLSVQCSNVDRAFSLHCDELIEAKTQLEMKLTQVHE